MTATIIRTNIIPQIIACARQMRTEGFTVQSAIIDPSDVADLIAEACERYPQLSRELPDEPGYYKVQLHIDGINVFALGSIVPMHAGKAGPGSIEVTCVRGNATSWPEFFGAEIVIRCVRHDDCRADHDIGRACLADMRRRA